MRRLIAIELLKLRTSRLTFALLATAAGLTGLDAVLRGARAGKGRTATLDTTTGLASTLTITGFGVLMAMVLGVIVASGEFRHGTATLTYLAGPRRVRVLTAKAVAAAVAGLVFGAVSAAVSTGVALLFVRGHRYAVTLPARTITGYAFGAVLAAGLMAAVGVALGSLVRSQIGATIGVFVWVFLVESIVGGYFTWVDPYLPFSAGTSLAGSNPGGGGFGFGGSSPAEAPLPFAGALVLVVAVAVVLGSVAAVTTVPRDVT